MTSWLQKHPSPTARDGAFHWHPADGDRESRNRFVERMRGVEPPAVLWTIEPDRVAWATLWSAMSPLDHRRYSGMTLATAPALDELAAPVEGPYPGAATNAPASNDPATIAVIARVLLGAPRALAVASPIDPRLVAHVVGMLPRAHRIDGVVRIARTPSDLDDDRVAQLVARAHPAWPIIRELADATGRDADAIVRDATLADDHARRVNAWGRAFESRDLDAVADATAMRAIAYALAGASPGKAIAEVRWHALLPAARRATLLGAIALRTPALAEYAHA